MKRKFEMPAPRRKKVAHNRLRPAVGKAINPILTAKKTAKKRVTKKILKKAKKLSRKDQAIALTSEEEVEFFIKNDPTKTNKYLVWMATQKKLGYNNEDITATVKSFDRRSATLKHSDIYKYGDLKVLENEILDLSPSRAERKYLQNLKTGVDYISLLENETIRLYYVTSMKGIKNLGKGSRWCIVADTNYWRSYNASNDVFVVINAQKESDRYALLRNTTRYNRGQYTLYNKSNSSLNLNNSFSPLLVEEIQEKINLILSISGKKQPVSTTAKAYLLSSPNENKPKEITSKITELAEEVRKHSLVSIMPFSKNEALIRAMQQDIRDNLGKVTFHSNYSAQFLKVFKEDMDNKEIENIILNTVLTGPKLGELDFVIKNFTKAKFKSFIKKIKYKKTKNALIKYHSKYFNCLDKADMTEQVALAILKKEGENALLKIYTLYGKKRKRRYNYSNYTYVYDSKLTTAIKKMTLSKTIMETLIEKKDCPAVLKTFLKKKLNKKVYTIKEHAKWNKVLEIYLADKDDSTDAINIKDFKEYVAKISTPARKSKRR